MAYSQNKVTFDTYAQQYSSSILSDLQTIASTPYGSALLNRGTVGNLYIRFQQLLPGQSGPAQGGRAGNPPMPTVYINYPGVSSMYWFNQYGQVVQGGEALTIAHELAHAIDTASDPLKFINGQWHYPSDSEMNSSNFDFKGSAVHAQNTIALQLGAASQFRASYMAAFISPPTHLALGFALGASYSDGSIVDIVRLGDLHVSGQNNDIDHSSRVDSSSDLIFGLDGDDYINGGGGNDYIYGGRGKDKIVGGRGNDKIDGGEENSGQNDLEDSADYSAVGSPITVNYSEAQSAVSITVDDGEGGMDTLHDIEKVIGTTGKDKFTFSGNIPQGVNLTLDANGGQKDTIDLSAAVSAAGMTLVITNASAGKGYIRSRGGASGIINIENFNTEVIGSENSDLITDESDGEHTIDGGDGDDRITVGGEDATIDGGRGNDHIILKSDAATIKFGIEGGSDAVEFEEGDGDYHLKLEGLNPGDIEVIAGGRDVYGTGIYDPDNPESKGFHVQFITVRVKATGDQITFLENGRNIGPDGNGSANSYRSNTRKLDSISFADGTSLTQDDLWAEISRGWVTSDD